MYLVLTTAECDDSSDDSSADTGAAVGNSTATPTADAGTAGTNVNAFTGSLGSAPVPVTSDAASARPFSVNGDTFLNEGAAIQRACDVQKNACANAANSGAGSFSVSDCDAQQQQCVAQSSSAKKQKSRRAVQFGECGSPAISFGVQADRGSEEAFAPVNTADFNHGSALKPAVITDFICSQLASKCQADDETISECEAGADAANALEGQAAADAFNAALGV